MKPDHFTPRSNAVSVHSPQFPASLRRYCSFTVMLLASLLLTDHLIAAPSITCPGSWTLIGGYSNSTFVGNSNAVDMNGVPYVTYCDQSYDGKVVVKKYVGGSWIVVGSSPISSGYVYMTTMVMDESGRPYVGYFDAGSPYNGNFVVKMYNGTNWVQVGTGSGVSGINYSGATLAVDNSTGGAYIAFVEQSSGRPKVMKCSSGGAWTDVGSAGYISYNTGGGAMALVVKNETPYVAYADGGTSYLVKKYNGSDWETVGGGTYESGQIYEAPVGLAVDGSGTVYVGYQSVAASYYAVIKKYSGSGWTTLGSGPASSYSVNRVTVALDAAERPYIGFLRSFSSKPVVRKYESGSWSSVGSEEFTSEYYSNAKLFMNGDDPYMMETSSNMDYSTYTTNYVLSVQKYSSTPSTITASASSNGSISPSGATTVCNGSSQEYTFTPDPGYQVGSILIDGIDVGPASSYTFSSITSSHTISVTFCIAPTVHASGSASIYQGQSTGLTATGADTYVWTPTTGLTPSTGNAVTANPAATTTYTVRGTSGGCSNTDTVRITVNDCGGGWTSLGTAISNVYDQSRTAVGSDGTPYVIYMDQTHSYKAFVKKYVGGSWVNVGGSEGISVDHVNSVAIATYGAVPYIAYPDQGAPYYGNIVVKRYNGSNWELVGDQPNGASSIPGNNWISMAVSSGGTPYVVFGDTYNSIGRVIMYDGSSWVSVGSALSTAYTPLLSISLDNSGTPYVALLDNAASGRSFVKKFNGSNWETLGGTFEDYAFSAPGASMAVDGSGTVYVAYSAPYEWNARVKKFNGSYWETVGSSPSPGNISMIAVAVDNTGAPYVLFDDQTSSYKAIVMKYNGSSWDSVGTRRFSGAASKLELDMNGSVPFATVTSSMFTPPYSYINPVSVYKLASPNTITTSAGSNGAISPAGVTYKCNGDEQTYTITPASGYQVADVLVDGSSVGVVTSYTFSSLGASHTISATFSSACNAPAITSAATVTNVNCYGNSTGAVTPHVSGDAPLTWSWSNDATTASLSGVMASTYTYTVSNGCGTVTGTATVSQPAAALTATRSITNVSCFGGHTGGVVVGATGGTSPYSGTGDFSGLSAGSFSYTVTDANGCTSVSSGTITQPATALATSGTVSNALCYGSSTGSVSVTATGGTSPYSGTGNFSGLSAGPFSYTVTDANGCTSNASGSVGQPDQLTASKTITNANCFGESNGSVLVGATGGTTPYSGTGNMTGLTAGSFSYTVTDAHGCTSSVSGSVSEPAQLVASKSVTNVLCYGNSTGSVVVSATGGTSPYSGTATYADKTAGTYNYTVTDAHGCTSSISATVNQPVAALSASKTISDVLCFGGNTGRVLVSAGGGTTPYSGTGNFDGLSAGPFSYTVTDANGCTSSVSGTVGQPTLMTASKSVTNANCYGESNGSVLVTATGGTTPYSGTGNMTGVSAGPFSYTVTDANGCTSTVIGTVSEPTLLVASKTVTDVLCFGASTGSVSVTATGGTTPYTGTGNYTGKAAGTYNYTVTDAHGCTSSISATVTQPEGGLVASKTITNVNCYGENNGSVLVSATGGVTPYTGDGNKTGLYAGPFSYTVTDANGCSSTVTGTVTQPTLLVANKTVTNVRCYDENNGQVIVGATGGTSPYAGTGTFGPLAPEAYSYTVTDAHGCTSTVSGTITQPALLIASNTPVVSPSGFNLLCNKGATGIVNVSATGGTTPYSNTGAHGGLAATGYEFFVTDAHGCIDSTSGTLDQPEPFYISASTSDDTICNGESVSLSATGSSSYYTWYTNNGLGTTNSASPVTATPTTGTPTVTVGYRAIGYNGFGCPSEPDTVDVTVLPIGYFTGPNAVCTEYSVDLDNGTPGGVWYTPDTAYISLDQNGLVSANMEFVNSSYPRNTTITYTMPNGCMRTKVQTVNITPQPIMGIATVCPNSGLSLPAGIPSGGTWTSSNANMTITMAGNGIATVYGGSSLGTANISYTMPTGCYVYKTFTVAPMAPITGPTQVCTGNTVTLTHPLAGAQWSSGNTSMATVGINTGVVSGLSASAVTISYKVNPTCFVTYVVTVSTTPGTITGPASVCKTFNSTLANPTTGGTWMSSNITAATVGSTTGIVNGADVGTSNISYVMPSGCYSSKTVSVNANPAAITGANNVCTSRTSPYSIASTGGSWSSSSSILTIDGGTGLASGVSAGNANISYTLSTGCYSYKAVTVAALPAAITGTTTMCEGGTTTLTSTTPSLTWTSLTTSVATVAPATSTTGTVTGLLAGTSTISYTSAAGCTQTVNVTVYAAPGPISGNTNVCVGASTTYTNSVAGGTWSSAATSMVSVGSATGIVTGIGAGSFTLTYTMPGGCKAYKTATVDAQPAIISGTLSTCAGGNTTLTSTPTGQTWSSASPNVSVGASSGIVTGVAIGTALVNYTNAAGCVRTTTVTVSVGLPAIAAPSSICAGGSTTLTNSTTGGTWASSNGAVGSIVSTSGLITGISTGTTNVTYRTSATCFTTTSVSVLSAPSAITGPATSVCQNATLQLTHGTTGGTWTSSTPAKATVDASGLVTGVGSGTTTISYAPAPGCMTTYNVSVNAIPNAITGTTTVCVAATTTLATTSTGGSWSSSNTDDATVNASGVVAGIDAGTSTISYKFIATGCYATKDVTVNALPNAITGDNAVCAGLADTFTNSTTGGTWTSFTPTVGTIGATTGILSALAGGTTTISYTLPTGCRTTKVFTVYALPASTITGTATVCEGTTTTLTCTTAGQTWSSTNTTRATIVPGSTTTGIVTGIAAGTTTISYTTAQGCARTYVVTVNTSPASIVGNFVLCAGKVDTLTDTTPGGTWNSSNLGTANIGVTTGYITAAAAGTTNISYTLPNGCRKTSIVTVNAIPSSISGSLTLCGNSVTTLNCTTTGGAWTSNNTDIATAVTTNSVTGTITGGLTPGTATISYTSALGCSRTTVVTVSAALPAITGPDAICVGTPATFTSGTGGTWISSNTAKGTIVSTTGVATGVAAGTTTLSYKVSAQCYAVKDVTVNGAVAAITGTTNVCAGNSTTLSCTTPGGTWSSQNSGTASVLDNSVGVVTGAAAGTTLITYQVTATGCFKTTSVNVLASPAAIGGTTTILVGTTTTLNNTVTGGTWSSSASTIAGIGSVNGIMTGVSLGNATISYKLSNGCYKTALATIVSSLSRPVRGTTQDMDATLMSVRIFPNPSQGNITVEAPANGTFMVFSMDGKQVARFDVTAPASSVSLPYNLAAGMYMCRFEGVDGSNTVVRLVYKP